VLKESLVTPKETERELVNIYPNCGSTEKKGKSVRRNCTEKPAGDIFN